jgi:2Fe-2S ferredoxin
LRAIDANLATLPEDDRLHTPPPMSTITVHLQAASGAMHTLQVRVGRSLMKAAVSDGVEAIAADCGGGLTCATCHVLVDEPWFSRLPAAAADELSMLDMTAAPREAGSRLSCQIELSAALDGLLVRLPSTQY